MNGERLEKAKQKLRNKNKKIFNKSNLSSYKNLIEKTKNEYLKSLKPIATRKTSELFLDIIMQVSKFNWWFC